MGMTKRIRISQRMSQHIMQLKLTLRIVSPPIIVITNRVDMFISQTYRFVNGKMKKYLALILLQKMMPDAVLFYAITVLRFTLETLLKIFASICGFVSFRAAISFFVSRRLEEVVPSSWQVVQVSVK